MAKGRKGAAKRAATKRADLKADRKIARKAGKTAEVRQLSKKMRKQGDIMRRASGREKGQRTTYTGPAQESTIDKILADTGDTLSKTGTKWQQVNKAWLNDLMEKHNISLVQARSKLKTIFSNNRERFLEEQQQRYDANIVAPVLDKEIEELNLGNKGKGKVVPKITGGSEYLATDYDRPAFQDWSDLEPPNMPGLLGSAKAQQDLLGSGMAAYQPWAQPAIEYQPPAGPTYATRASLLGGASPSVSGTGDDVITTKDNGKTYGPGGTYDNYQDWYMAPENPAGHYWALANAARAKGETSPWGNQMVNGIWQYTGGSSPLGPLGSTAARQDITQNQFQDLFADAGQAGGRQLSAYNTVNPLERSALSNVSYTAPLAAPTASAASPTFASVPIGGWQGRTNISNNAAQLNALNAMENIARSNAGILAGGAAPYGDYGAYATPQSILAMQGTST